MSRPIKPIDQKITFLEEKCSKLMTAIPGGIADLEEKIQLVKYRQVAIKVQIEDQELVVGDISSDISGIDMEIAHLRSKQDDYGKLLMDHIAELQRLTTKDEELVRTGKAYRVALDIEQEAALIRRGAFEKANRQLDRAKFRRSRRLTEHGIDRVPKDKDPVATELASPHSQNRAQFIHGLLHNALVRKALVKRSGR